jgi:dienelactone hydrolase
MIAFHFGAPERLLFGLFHPAGGGARDDRAVLLCNPFGQEAVRSHRLFRVLAERLARQGLPTLRFDYHATGDSPGADETGDLEGWVGDVRLALRELAQRSGAKRIVCVGARLGAALAARAASGFPGASRLVLWDPVVHGAAYLAMLRVKHVESLEASYSLADPAWRRDLENDPQAFTDEAIGFGMSAALRQQIRKLGPHSLPLPPGVDVHVVSHPSDAAVNAWFAPHAQQPARHLWPLEQSFDWTAEERRNSPLVPPQALTRLISTICD